MLKRTVTVLLLLVSLTACAGGPSDHTIPDPPQAKVVTESTNNAQADQVLSGWKTSARKALTDNAVKPDTLEEKAYVSTATPAEIAAFYDKDLKAKGWVHASRTPGEKEGVLVNGYEAGNWDAVVGAVDLAKFGGTGTLVYTLKGTR